MADHPRRLAVILGGASVEHTISIRSARAVMAACDRERWRPVPFAVDRLGRWLSVDQSAAVLAAIDRGAPEEIPSAQASVPIDHDTMAALQECDAVFPLIHGATGEDGMLQGFLELLGLPYVGSDVAASALAMDKTHCKQILRQAGIPVAPSITISCADWESDATGVLRRAAVFGYPYFVKPSRGGSSIGTSKVESLESAASAVAAALACDDEVLIEEAMPSPREIECGVLGSRAGGAPIASPLGEIRSPREFYDYTAKYEDPATEMIAPAEIDAATARRLQELSLEAWRAVGAAGMVRADFLIGSDGRIWLGELNTIPGFTSASMYPVLFEAAGIPLPELIDRLVELGIERCQRARRFRFGGSHA